MTTFTEVIDMFEAAGIDVRGEYWLPSQAEFKLVLNGQELIIKEIHKEEQPQVDPNDYPILTKIEVVLSG